MKKNKNRAKLVKNKSNAGKYAEACKHIKASLLSSKCDWQIIRLNSQAALTLSLNWFVTLTNPKKLQFLLTLNVNGLNFFFFF